MKGEGFVQNLLYIVLLCLNLIGVLYLIVKDSVRQKFDYEKDIYQKIIENQKKVILEFNEIKGTMEYYHLLFQQEYEQWKSERQAMELSDNAETKSNISQSLFLNDRFKEIFDLQKQGLSVEQIATKLGKGTGEVSFILQLAAQELV
jgi:hypothetical protein